MAPPIDNNNNVETGSDIETDSSDDDHDAGFLELDDVPALPADLFISDDEQDEEDFYGFGQPAAGDVPDTIWVIIFIMNYRRYVDIRQGFMTRIISLNH